MKLKVCDEIKDVIEYLDKKKNIDVKKDKRRVVLSLRRELQLSDITNLDTMLDCELNSLDRAQNLNKYVFGAWLRLCMLQDNGEDTDNRFDINKVPELKHFLKEIMCSTGGELDA